MFKIGDFSRLGRVSIRALCHYDELGLLKPAATDALTGYRFYALEQLPNLQRIVVLTSLGFSLTEVRTLLDDALGEDVLRRLLQQKQADVQRRLELEAKRLKGLEDRLTQLGAGRAHLYDIVIKAVPALTVLAKRETVPNLSLMSTYCSQLSETLWRVLETVGLNPSGPEMLLYHTDGYALENVEVEICVELGGAVNEAELPPGFSVRQVPGAGEVASLIHHGHYLELEEAADALIFWTGTNGYISSGALREIHLSGAVAHLGKDAPAVTELQVPLAKVSAPPA